MLPPARATLRAHRGGGKEPACYGLSRSETWVGAWKHSIKPYEGRSSDDFAELESNRDDWPKSTMHEKCIYIQARLSPPNKHCLMRAQVLPLFRRGANSMTSSLDRYRGSMGGFGPRHSGLKRPRGWGSARDTINSTYLCGLEVEVVYLASLIQLSVGDRSSMRS